jgi:hypothetical protein
MEVTSPGRVSGDGYGSLSDDEALLARDLNPIDPESYTYNAETHNGGRHRASTSGSTSAESGSVETPTVHIKSEIEVEMAQQLAPYKRRSEMVENSCLAFKCIFEDENKKGDMEIVIGRISSTSSSALENKNECTVNLIYLASSKTTTEISQFDGMFTAEETETSLRWGEIVATGLELVEGGWLNSFVVHCMKTDSISCLFQSPRHLASGNTNCRKFRGRR